MGFLWTAYYAGFWAAVAVTLVALLWRRGSGRVLAKESGDPLRRLIRIHVATGMDPGHHGGGAAAPDRAAAPARRLTGAPFTDLAVSMARCWAANGIVWSRSRRRAASASALSA